MGPGTSGVSPANINGGGIYSFRRPTANASPDLDRGNHSYKAGSNAVIGNFMYAQDPYLVKAHSRSDPEKHRCHICIHPPLSPAAIWIQYASFLLGAVDGNVGVPRTST